MNVKSLNRYTVTSGIKGGIPPLLVLFLGISANGQSAETTSGYGPPTSLPTDLSMTKPASRPARNWIDQSQAEADAKSIGCNQCHKGIEPMHQASHVILGC